MEIVTIYKVGDLEFTSKEEAALYASQQDLLSAGFSADELQKIATNPAVWELIDIYLDALRDYRRVISAPKRLFEVGEVSGSFDESPPSPGYMDQFRGLHGSFDVEDPDTHIIHKVRNPPEEIDKG